METIYTVINKDYKKKHLKRAMALSGTGVIVLAGFGVFLPIALLSHWGWMIFLLCGGLIVVGMVPYRRLTLLELHPDKLIIDDEDILHYIKNGKETFTIACDKIQCVQYHESTYGYGILMRVGGKDYLFPWFNQRACDNLEGSL